MSSNYEKTGNKSFGVVNHKETYETYRKMMKKDVMTSMVDDGIIDKSETNQIFGFNASKLFMNIITHLEGFTLSLPQYLFTFLLHVASLKLFFLDDYYTNAKQIQNSYGLKYGGIEEIFFFAERRIGKTVAMAINSVVNAMTLPSRGKDTHIVVFSITLEAAERFIYECAKANKMIPYAENFNITVNNQSVTYVNKNDPGRTIKIHSLCSRGEVCIIILF